MFDIFHVEDLPVKRESLQFAAMDRELTYLGVGSLDELMIELGKGTRGKTYVLDGQFPEKARGQIEFLAPRATQTIREVEPNARIIWYTGNNQDEREAQKLGVRYFCKHDVKVEELLREIQKL